MIEKLTDYLKTQGWFYTSDKFPDVISFPIGAMNANFNCLIDISGDGYIFSFVTYNGAKCPLEKRLLLAELFNRLNFSIRYGNFEVGMEGGEIKFRTSIVYEGMEVNDKIIENVIKRNIDIHDFSFPFISSFLFGNLKMDEVYHKLFPPAIENREQKV